MPVTSYQKQPIRAFILFLCTDLEGGTPTPAQLYSELKSEGKKELGLLCADVQITAWQFVVQLTYSISLWNLHKAKPQNFIHDHWFLADLNSSKHVQEIAYNGKANMGLLYCCHWEFCYWIPDFRYRGKKHPQNRRCKRSGIGSVEIYSLVSMIFLATPLRTWVLGLFVTCDCPCFSQNYFVCVIQKCSFGIFISFKTLKVITVYDWEWKIFFLALLCVWNSRFENTLQNLYAVGV